jgi:phospholipid transport system transporter-binding protein
MISVEGERCTLEGPITFDNVVAVLEEGARALPAAPRIVIDLARVTDVDSAAVSLLLEWRRTVERSGRAIAFVNLPENLQSLARLYGVTELLVETKDERREK